MGGFSPHFLFEIAVSGRMISQRQYSYGFENKGDSAQWVRHRISPFSFHLIPV